MIRSILRKTPNPRRWGIMYGRWFFGLVDFTPAPVEPAKPDPFYGNPCGEIVLTPSYVPRPMAEGCCSASFPCGHQKHDPYSLCEVCQKVKDRQSPAA